VLIINTLLFAIGITNGQCKKEEKSLSREDKRKKRRKKARKRENTHDKKRTADT